MSLQRPFWGSQNYPRKNPGYGTDSGSLKIVANQFLPGNEGNLIGVTLGDILISQSDASPEVA